MRWFREKNINLSGFIGPIVLIAMFLFFAIYNPNFASSANIVNLLKQASALFVVATGASIIILMGSIDLSTDGVVTLSGVITVLIANKFVGLGAVSLILCILASVLAGAGIGLINGTLVTMLKLPSFLVTLGMSTICRGLSLIFTNGMSVPCTSAVFKEMGRSHLLGVPLIGIVALSVLAIFILVSSKTRFGRHVYAVGGGERVASLCGVPTEKIKLFSFMLAGALAGLAGIIVSTRIGSASNIQGDGMALDSITAVVMGGTSLNGGRGGVGRTITGVMIIIMISNGLNMLGVPTYTQILIKGLVVILAVAVTSDRKSKMIVK